MKKILYLILFLCIAFSGKAVDPNWKLHPIFDEDVSYVVETPSYVYFTSRNLVENPAVETFSSLFRYDKKGEELLPLSSANILNGNNIRQIAYNPQKGYLFVLYYDYNIDLIYNDGKVVNLPDYSRSELSYSKNVNSISMDPDKDRVYLATDFGYVALNDKKYEVAESRIYGEPLKSFSRVGDEYWVLHENILMSIPDSSPRLSLDQYEEVATFANPLKLFPLNETTSLMFTGDKNRNYVKKIVKTSTGIEAVDIVDAKVYNIERNPNGVIAVTGDKIYQIDYSGELTVLERPEEYKNSAAYTLNMAEVWNGLKRKGLSSVKKTGDNWSVTHDWMLPNAPATYVTTSFANHPSLGLLMLSYGYTPITYQMYDGAPMQLSSYKQGRWKNHALAYTNPARSNIMTTTSGMLVDPDRPEYVYITSYHQGIMRLNLNDPEDIIHMTKTYDADSKNEGFVELGPEQNTARNYWNIMPPQLDSSGNIWMAYANNDDNIDPSPNYYCWLSADRKATSSASDIKMPQIVKFDGYAPPSNLACSLTLLKTGKGVQVYTLLVSGITYFHIIDTNGTPIDTSDDKVYSFQRFEDSDGDELDLQRVRSLIEDPATGYVWIAHETGVCYFSPSQVMKGDYTLHRVKVPRNDGTNLADYLLEGVMVNGIAIDSAGRKWFATAGGGVVCTTSDGREILEEFNMANSPLPSDDVIGVAYNSDANSIMFSTTHGYAEYLLPVSQTSSTKTDIRAYPNPVRSDFSGYVTITDIPSGSFVKITDIAGNLVKELGVMSGFEILWDVSDSNFNRVKSGVYHIMVSPSNESSSYSTVGKILVMN